MITLEEIKKLRAEATPGPWTIASDNDDDDYPVINGKPHYWIYTLQNGKTIAYSPNEQDAAFLKALPQIADECIRLAEENERLKEELYDLKMENLEEM